MATFLQPYGRGAHTAAMRYSFDELTAPVRTISDRVWYAWLCLPRGPDGEPPSFRSLEEEHSLPEGIFSKVIRGARRSLSMETAKRMSKALAVPFEWLVLDEATQWRPRLTGPFRSRVVHHEDRRRQRVTTLLQRMGFGAFEIEFALHALFGDITLGVGPAAIVLAPNAGPRELKAAAAAKGFGSATPEDAHSPEDRQAVRRTKGR